MDEIVARREAFLTDYQDAAYAARYRALVDKVKAAEARVMPGSTALAEAVARYGFKLMAYKDEYEVARLYSDGAFRRQVDATFEGENLRFNVHLAPPFLARKDPNTGLPRKMSFGPWIMPVFGVLARFRRCAARGSIRSATPMSAGPSAGSSPTISRWWMRSSPGLPPPTTRSPSASLRSRRRFAASATSRSGT